MNNFFSNSADYNLFKKALRSTSNEPVVINIMSNDSSLEKPEEEVKVNVERKNMSSKYQASPFGKFFGPRKQRTDPIDMKDFSSWKNKNFRQSEQQVAEETEEKTTFSFSDYLKSRTRDAMYNDEDKIKADLQKPIDQMSIYDEKYNRFSLDSYLNKLEQQSKVDKDFKETEDLMDPFENAEEVVPTSEQDENFSYSAGVDIEKVAFEEAITGDKFAFEREELDKVRTRLDKLEREANNIKEKQTEKVISTNELTDIAKGDEDEEDGFNLDKLGFEDEVDSAAESAKKSKEGDSDSAAPKKTFFEINRTGDSKTPFVAQRKEQEEKTAKASDDKEDLSKFFEEESENNADNLVEEKSQEPEVQEESASEEKTVTEPVDDNLAAETTEAAETQESEETAETDAESEIKQDVGGEALTKAEFKSITDEIISKFSDMYKTDKETEETVSEVAEIDTQTGEIPAGIDANSIPGYNTVQPYDGSYATQQPPNGYMQEYPTQMGHGTILQQQNELQAKMLELLEQNKKSDSEVAEKLRLAELEKQKVAEEYENRLKELEKTIRQREEDAKQKAYIEKLKNDIKLKKAETDYKVREARMKESAKHHSNIQFVGAQLKAELKNSINVSNLEMEKMLLECVTKINKEAQKEKERQLEEAQAKLEAETEVDEAEEVEEVVEEPKAKTTRARTTRGRTTRRTTRTHSHTRTPRRKIDSDIIGGINFD